MSEPLSRQISISDSGILLAPKNSPPPKSKYFENGNSKSKKKIFQSNFRYRGAFCAIHRRPRPQCARMDSLSEKQPVVVYDSNSKVTGPITTKLMLLLLPMGSIRSISLGAIGPVTFELEPFWCRIQGAKILPPGAKLCPAPNGKNARKICNLALSRQILELEKI